METDGVGSPSIPIIPDTAQVIDMMTNKDTTTFLTPPVERSGVLDTPTADSPSPTFAVPPKVVMPSLGLAAKETIDT